MKKYISPNIKVVNVESRSTILAGSNDTITGGGSNADQVNPTAESKRFVGWEDDIWMDDEE